MSLIDPSWVADEHFEYIDNRDTLTTYYAVVDREIQTQSIMAGVPVPDIPVDGSGYVSSVVLQSYGIAVLKYEVFFGYWGKRNGNDDIYHAKLMQLKEKVDELKNMITAANILGYDPTDTTAETGYSAIKQTPWY